MNNTIPLKNVGITKTVANSLRMVRISHNVNASDLAGVLHKSSAYISKLEKGGIQKLKPDVFKTICDYITGSDDGMTEVVQAIAKSMSSLDTDTSITVKNIDDLLILRPVTHDFLTFVKSFMQDCSISSSALLNKINSSHYDSLSNDLDMEKNVWIHHPFYDNASIFICSLPDGFIDEFLNGAMQDIQRIYAEGILNALSELSGKDNTERQRFVDDAIAKFHFQRCYDNSEDFMELYKYGISQMPQSAQSIFLKLNKLLSELWIKSPTTVQTSLSQMIETLEHSPGFMLALIRMDYSEITRKTASEKKAFIGEVEKLVSHYEEQTDPVDDLQLYD